MHPAITFYSSNYCSGTGTYLWSLSDSGLTFVPRTSDPVRGRQFFRPVPGHVPEAAQTVGRHVPAPPTRARSRTSALPTRNTEARRRSTTTSRCSQSWQRGMEPLWSRVAATGGNPRQIGPTRKARNKANPLPPAASGFVRHSMVRRGRRFESFRGLCKSAANRRFLFGLDLQNRQCTVGMEPFMEPLG